MAGERSLGIMLPRDLAASRVMEFARAAERAGFDELWVVEDCFYRGGIAQAAVVLAVTRRIHVGVGILPAAARNAAFAALEIATLAELFPGRTTIGVGHGMPEWMRQVGAWPASALAMLDETISSITALLAGDEVTVDGRYVKLNQVRLQNAPADPPLLLAGMRGPKSLALSGRVAGGTVLAEPVSPEYLAAARDQIGRGLAGTPARHRIVAYNVGSVHPDAAVARTVARGALAAVGEPDWSVHIDPLPFAAEFRELRERFDTGEEFAAALPDEWVDQLAVVGDAERARARLDQLYTAGAASIVLIPAGPGAFGALESLSTLI